MRDPDLKDYIDNRLNAQYTWIGNRNAIGVEKEVEQVREKLQGGRARIVKEKQTGDETQFYLELPPEEKAYADYTIRYTEERKALLKSHPRLKNTLEVKELEDRNNEPTVVHGLVRGVVGGTFYEIHIEDQDEKAKIILGEQLEEEIPEGKAIGVKGVVMNGKEIVPDRIFLPDDTTIRVPDWKKADDFASNEAEAQQKLDERDDL